MVAGPFGRLVGWQAREQGRMLTFKAIVAETVPVVLIGVELDGQVAGQLVVAKSAAWTIWRCLTPRRLPMLLASSRSPLLAPS